MPRVGVQLIFGANEEPFLEAALRSVEWADYVCAVNTAPLEDVAVGNELLVRSIVPPDKLRMRLLRMETFDFAVARNAALELADPGDYVLIVDSDDVHWPQFEGIVRAAVEHGDPVYAAHFWHHCVYKDLWHSLPHRKILFRYDKGVHFENTMGAVHEELFGLTAGGLPLLPDKYTVVPEYRYNHYGYIKPAAEVSARWEFYRSLGAEIHDYDVSEPDHALDDWPRVCKIYTGEHPPAVRGVLEQRVTQTIPDGRSVEVWPSSPPDIFKGRNPNDGDRPRVGLVMLTWDDEENLRRCLATLERTTEPFELCVVDNGSTDDSVELVREYAQRPGTQIQPTVYVPLGAAGDDQYKKSLTEALNIGFDNFLHREDLDYIGWIHPDHVFEWPFWLTELRQAMDDHPEYAKLGATEAGHPAELRAGNTQCYLIRRTALEQVGLFDEGYIACGGWEDWDHNRRLLEVGQVMIWPDAIVRHEAMSTRARHDNVEAARRNAGHYVDVWGDDVPPV